MLEKFDVFLCDGIFYTMEGLEELGLQYLKPGQLRIRYNKLIRYANGEETIYEKEWDYLDEHPNETIFIKPILEDDKYTLVVVVEPFFGIRYLGNEAIMKSKDKRDKIFSEMENFINDKILKVPNSKYQRNYQRQVEEKRKAKRLENLIPKHFDKKDN